MKHFSFVIMTAAILHMTTAAVAAPHDEEIRKILPEIQNTVVTQGLIDALRVDNEKHRNIVGADIDAMIATWLSELDSPDHPLISSVVENPLALRLRQIMEDRPGLINEIGVINAAGLEIAQTNPYSDLWQGGSEKFNKTFRTGASAEFIDVIDYDGPTQSIGSQANFSIADPDTGKAIGLVTINFNLAALE